MRKLNQKGFSLVEGLLIVIALALVVFVGYYVWHTQKDINKQSSATTTASQKSSKQSKSAVASGKYVTIPEWNIKAAYSGSLHIEHKYEPPLNASDPSVVWFSSEELDATGEVCASKIEYGGWIFRYSKNQHYIYEDGSDSGKTAAQEAAEPDLKNVMHIDDYYYFYNHPQSACGDNADVQEQTINAVTSLLSKFQSAD